MMPLSSVAFRQSIAAILVPADDLKAVLARWLADREHIFMPRIRINPTEGTLNGIPVTMEWCQY